MSISQISEAAKLWVAKASPEQLRAKLDEYADLAGNLSPRDSEARLQLGSAIRAELARRS